MSLESKAGWWLRADTAISWLLALPGLVDPEGVAAFFGAEEPSYSFLVRLWSGLLFLFGWVSWRSRSFIYPFLIHWFIFSLVVIAARTG